MKELVRLRMRPSRDRKSFRYMLDYVDQSGKRRQVSLSHADKRQAERQRQEKELELRVNVAGPVFMRLTHFFRDSLARTKGQVRTTTLKEAAKSMNDFVACVGDIDFANMTVEVSPKKDCDGTWEWYIKDTDRRILPLTADLVKLLVELQLSEPEGNPYVFVPIARYELIQELRRTGQWTVEKGRSPLSKFSHHFNKIRQRAGIASGTFHDLRRTCLSNWIVQGLSLHEVKELAGHAGIETTDRFYLAVRKDVVDRARAASDASRKGESVAHLLCASGESDEIGRPPCVSALRTEG